MNIVLKEEIEHDDNIKSVLTNFDTKESKIVIVDADYLPFKAGHPGKDEFGDKNADLSEEEAVERLNEIIMKLYLSIEKYFIIDSFYLITKGRNNFRKQIDPDYKKNRKGDIPEIVLFLDNYLRDNLNAIPAPSGEADDLVYTLSKKLNHEGIVVSPDKDLLQIPSIIYNPNKDKWVKIDQTTADYNLALQMLIGDSCDNIKVNKGIGIKKASNIINPKMSKFQYIKYIYLTYCKHYDKSIVKDKIKNTYNLLKLYEV
jgi:5'-3' exonuclease